MRLSIDIPIPEGATTCEGCKAKSDWDCCGRRRAK